MSELAAKVGLSKTPVQARVKRLEKDGYIRGYPAIIDRERMGEGHVAFVQVKLSDTRSAALDAFNRAVQGVPEIEQCHMMAASFDYLLKVRTTRHRRLSPRARRAHLRPAPCRADLDLRGDGDGEGPLTQSASVFRNATSAARSRSDSSSGWISDSPSDAGRRLGIVRHHLVQRRELAGMHVGRPVGRAAQRRRLVGADQLRRRP